MKKTQRVSAEPAATLWARYNETWAVLRRNGYLEHPCRDGHNGSGAYGCAKERQGPCASEMAASVFARLTKKK